MKPEDFWSVAFWGGLGAALGFVCIGGTLMSVGGPAHPVAFAIGLLYLALAAAGFALFIAANEMQERLAREDRRDADLEESIRAIGAEAAALARARHDEDAWREAIGAGAERQEEREAA